MSASEPDGWITASRLRRLQRVLVSLRSHPPPGLPRDRTTRSIWKLCNGPLDETPRLIEILVGAGLVEFHHGFILLTRLGRRAATQDHQYGGQITAAAVLTAGYLRSQTRRLLEMGDMKDDGTFICPREHVYKHAPQLGGLLRLWPKVAWDTHLRVPATLVAELLASWALSPIHTRTTNDKRKKIGDRAEAYSYQFETERSADPTKIHWVAQDDDTLGYDIEDVSAEPRRRIEVKGSMDFKLRFFLSVNEWKVAHVLAAAYEIQFWGGIQLSRSPAEEFRELRSQGYPLIFKNLKLVLSSGGLVAEPSEYLIKTPGA